MMCLYGYKIIINNEGLYWIRISDKNGCYAKENISVISKNCQNLIYFPNSFTPNNDGINDIFKPTVYGTLEKYQLSIYNRYGQLVFHTKDLFSGWDGSFINKVKNTGTFIWVSNYTFSGKLNETQTGSILLLK